MKRIGILGGSFNPIHLAHLVLAEQAREALALDRVIFVPARLPPHKDAAALAGARDRLKMVRLAVADHPQFAVSDMELRREGPSYTIDTVRALRRRFGRNAKLYFLIGSDTVAELPTWRDIRRLVKLCDFVPLSRPDVRPPSRSVLARAIGRKEASDILSRAIRMPLLGISASGIRRRVAEGRSIRYLVPDAVAEYIRRKNLYPPASATGAATKRASRKGAKSQRPRKKRGDQGHAIMGGEARRSLRTPKSAI